MDFLSGIFKPLADAWASVEDALVGTPQLAGIGLILLIGAAFALLVLGIAALVRLAAVVVLGAPPVTYQWATQVALAAGATDDEIVGTLIAVAPVPGVTRAVSAAPELAIALGYDVDEALDPGSTPRSRDD